jgi:FKBP-type peptidyl-prolyl cis-trans isomerase 2
LKGLGIQTGEARDYLHCHLREFDLTARNREGEILVPPRQEFGPREEDQVAVSGQGDFAEVQRLSLGTTEKWGPSADGQTRRYGIKCIHYRERSG